MWGSGTARRVLRYTNAGGKMVLAYVSLHFASAVVASFPASRLYSQTTDLARSHFCTTRLWSIWKRFSRDHVQQEILESSCRIAGSVTVVWLTTCGTIYTRQVYNIPIQASPWVLAVTSPAVINNPALTYIIRDLVYWSAVKSPKRVSRGEDSSAEIGTSISRKEDWDDLSTSLVSDGRWPTSETRLIYWEANTIKRRIGMPRKNWIGIAKQDLYDIVMLYEEAQEWCIDREDWRRCVARCDMGWTNHQEPWSSVVAHPWCQSSSPCSWLWELSHIQHPCHVTPLYWFPCHTIPRIKASHRDVLPSKWKLAESLREPAH